MVVYFFYNQEGKLLSKQWFDWCWDFSDGFAQVNLNNKCNFINRDGKFLSKQWFDWSHPFDEGYAKVKANGKLYHIDTKGKLTEG